MCRGTRGGDLGGVLVWLGGGRGREGRGGSTVVFETEKEGTGAGADEVVGDYVAVFPGDVLDVCEDWVSFLFPPPKD